MLVNFFRKKPCRMKQEIIILWAIGERLESFILVEIYLSFIKSKKGYRIWSGLAHTPSSSNSKNRHFLFIGLLTDRTGLFIPVGNEAKKQIDLG